MYIPTKWSDYSTIMSELMGNLQVTDSAGKSFSPDDGFAFWKKSTLALRENGGDAFFIGNGASASMASHCAADIMKNGKVRARVFTDNALITALGNDITYDHVFSEPLAQCMRSADMLVAISSSGASSNIINAAHVARKFNGFIVTLSAFGEDNPLRKLGDLNFFLPAKSYGFAENCHAVVLHHWMDIISSATPRV